VMENLKLHKSISIPAILQLGYSAISVLIPLLLYAVILIVGVPDAVSSTARYDLSLFLAGTVLILYLAYRIPGRIGRLVSLTLTLLLFALPLVRLWHTGASEALMVGGLLPISDANGYYWGARNLLYGGNFIDWGNLRPLFPGLLATLLALTQENLQITQAALVAITAIACFFAAREVQRSHGAFVGAVLITGAFLFFRPFAGFTMTENLGLPLGLLGFAVLWRSATKLQSQIAIIGIFLFTAALNARMGAIFVLPLLLLWGAYIFRRSARLPWRFVTLGAGVILLTFILNSILLKIVSDPNGGATFSNFSFTFYGILTNSDWGQVFKDYPELNNLPPAEQAERAYSLAFDVLRSDPFSIVRGSLRGYREFFSGNLSLFSLDWAVGSQSIVDRVLRPLGCIGLVVCLRSWKNPHFSLLLTFVVGILLSIPLLPLWDVGLRPYSVTIAVFFILPALGLVALKQLCVTLVKKIATRRQASPDQSAQANSNSSDKPRFADTNAVLIVGLSLFLLSYMGPIAIRLMSSPPELAEFSCPAGLEARHFRINPGSSIKLVGNRSTDDSQLPSIRIRDFRQGLSAISWMTDTDEGLRSLKAATTIVDTYNYEWLAAKTNIVPEESGWVEVCGTLKEFGPFFRLFQASSIRPVSIKSD
jgi:hypothetical protein